MLAEGAFYFGLGLGVGAGGVATLVAAGVAAWSVYLWLVSGFRVGRSRHGR